MRIVKGISCDHQVGETWRGVDGERSFCPTCCRVRRVTMVQQIMVIDGVNGRSTHTYRTIGTVK